MRYYTFLHLNRVLGWWAEKFKEKLTLPFTYKATHFIFIYFDSQQLLTCCKNKDAFSPILKLWYLLYQIQGNTCSFLFSLLKNTDLFNISCKVYIQPLNFAYIRLLNKPYENMVNLTGQNQPLKCCQPLEFLTHFKMGLDVFILKICGL